MQANNAPAIIIEFQAIENPLYLIYSVVVNPKVALLAAKKPKNATVENRPKSALFKFLNTFPIYHIKFTSPTVGLVMITGYGGLSPTL